MQGFGSLWAGLCSIPCVVFLLFSPPSALLRLFGYRAYSRPMRAQLGLIAFELYAAVLAALYSNGVLQRPAAAAAVAAVDPGMKAIAALAAVVTLAKTVITAVQMWDKDEVPRREKDDAELAEKLKTTEGMAPDGDEGSLASLARAMARTLRQTLQPAAQQQQPAAQHPAVHIHVA